MSAHEKALRALETIEDILADHRGGAMSASLVVSSVERIIHDYEAPILGDREYTSRKAAERMRRAAEVFARRVYVKQTYGAALACIAHLERVAVRARAYAETISRNPDFADRCEQASWLHSTIEDTDTTADDLRAAGFDPIVVRAVECLTRPRDAQYFQHIRALVASGDLIAMTVKLADNEDSIELMQSRPKDGSLDDLARCNWSAALLRNNLLPNGSADPLNHNDETRPRRLDA